MPPFPPEDINRIISSIIENERNVHTFFSTGRLGIKDGDFESEGEVLILGNRNPLKIKIEIVHPWGNPLHHILIEENEVQILSYPEKKHYFGNLGQSGSTQLFPMTLHSNQVWSFVRGYPTISDYYQAISVKRDEIRLLNAEGIPLQIIDFHPQGLFPKHVSTPEQDISLLFSAYENNDPNIYAKKIELHYEKNEVSLSLKIKQMVINRPIPQAVFHMETPKNFEKILLSYRQEEK